MGHRSKPTAKCVHCDSDFTPISTHHKYCSLVCREQFIALKLKKIIELKPCAICEKPFKPVVAAGKFCSAECRKEANKRNKKKYNDSDKGKETVGNYNKNYVRFNTSRELKNRNLIAVYGITIEQFDEMYDSQNGTCAICHKPPPEDQVLCVDHCHESNKIRQLLCGDHNRMLGNAQDDIAVLQSAIDYLIRHHPEKAII